LVGTFYLAVVDVVLNFHGGLVVLSLVKLLPQPPAQLSNSLFLLDGESELLPGSVDPPHPLNLNTCVSLC